MVIQITIASIDAWRSHKNRSNISVANAFLERTSTIYSINIGFGGVAYGGDGSTRKGKGPLTNAISPVAT